VTEKPSRPASAPSPLKLIGIVRVSGPGQKAKDTPEVQRAAIERIAEAHKATLIDVVEEVITVSELATTMSWITKVAPYLADPDTHVAVYHTDRLARPRNWGQDWVALELLRSTGTRIYFPGGVRDLSTEEGRLLTTMEAIIAGGERGRIIKRTRDGKAKAVNELRCVHGPQSLTTGIIYDRTTRRWGYDREAEKVKRAFHYLVHDNLSYVEIGKLVGYSSTPVRQWFERAIYKGIYETAWRNPDKATPDPGIPEQAEGRVYGGRGQEPQLIDDATWEAAQRVVATRRERHKKSRDASAEHLMYSGYLYSAFEPIGPIRDGVFSELDLSRQPRHALYGHATYGSSKQTAYACRCQHEVWDDRCGMKCWQPAERLHAALDAYFERVTAEDWFVDHLAESIARDNKSGPTAEWDDLSKALNRIDGKLSRLEDLYLDEGIDRPRYEVKRGELRREEDALRRRLAKVAQPTRPPTPDDLRAMARKMTFDGGWSVEAKREWLRKHDVRIRLSTEGIESATIRLPALEIEDETIHWQGSKLVCVPTTMLVPTWASLGRMTWDDLVGYDISDPWAIREAEEGLFKTGRVTEMLGVSYDRLRRLLKAGQIAEPQVKCGRLRMWSHAEIEEARRVLEGG